MLEMKRSSVAAAATLALGAGLLVAAPASAAAVDDTIDGITYEADDTDIAAGATVTAFDGSTTTVDIPDTVTIDGNGYDVVAVGASSFQSQSLTGVTIGENVETIGDSAFRGNNLGSVVIPDSVTSIEQGAFGLCQLSSVVLGEGLQTMGFAAFNYNSLSTVTIPASVTNLAGSVFSHNPSLTSVVFEGAPPTVQPASGVQSFDTSSGSLVLSYLSAYNSPGYTNGFTYPTWKGYRAQASDDPSLGDMNIEKTVAAASYVRVYDWDFAKTGEVEGYTVDGDDASADVNYNVSVTPNGYSDRYYVMTGTITVVNNTADAEEIMVTDIPSVGDNSECTVSDSGLPMTSSVTLGAYGISEFDYSCDLDDSSTGDGFNSAVVTWGNGESVTVSMAVEFTERDTSFENLTLSDDQGDPDGENALLGSATWNAEGTPVVFDYTLTKDGLTVGECTEVTNTARIMQTEGETSATVQLCPEAAPTPEPSSEPSAEPSSEPSAEPTPASGEDSTQDELAETGADNAAGIAGVALLLLLAGGASLLVGRRKRITHKG